MTFLRKNSFEFQMVFVLVNDTATREAITRKQERTFLDFIKNDSHYSNVAKSGMNPKVLQYLMGHSDISVTDNTYTHLKLDDAKEEMEKLALKAAEAESEFRQLGMKEEDRKVIKMA